MRTHRLPKNPGRLAPVVLLPLALVACTETMDGDPDGGTTNPDASVVETCPGPLPTAEVTCTDPTCTATEGTKSFGEATLDSATAKSWVVVTWATSEVAGENDQATIDYSKTVPGGLGAAGIAAKLSPDELRARTEARARAYLGDRGYEAVFSAERLERIRSEAALRAMMIQGPIDLSGELRGTAIRGRSQDLLPDGVHKQSQACSAAAPSCGAAALCVIPEGTTDGTCESALSLKFRTGTTTFDTVSAKVRKVGTHAAIVVDDADDASVTEDQVNELLTRFDTHIAPIDHQFFGEPRDSNGKDRDQNGVVILFLSARVGQTDLGARLVGFFMSDDLLPTAQQPVSNAADILYMQPPSATISMDAISGTLGHEYQHLINYYQKKVLRNSGPEDVWLDEGIASFAEDVLGYGGDAFSNIAAFLATHDQVSLTGAGGTGELDSSQRRGMAHLLVRYLFEQAGGATFGATITDRGGIAAVKKLVQSADTGTFLFTTDNTGRDLHTWVGDLLTTVAVSNAGYEGVSCNPKYFLAAPETDAFTGNQRGLSLRGTFRNAAGENVTLSGPNTATFDNDTGIPIGINGGEIRTLDVATGTVKIAIAGPVDYTVAFRPIPVAR
ncbi:hypothetical protein L6R52_02050 [Myxococcota bacterium]|nr:hypothetical protein [Myxococcota bacterium]